MAPNNLSDIFSEYGKILKPNSRHFYILALVFFFPNALFLLLSPTLSHLFINFSTHQPSTTNLQPHSLFSNLLYFLLALVFSNCGVISITYSVFHCFYNQPVNLSSTFNSIITSFLPLLATTIVSQATFFFITFFYSLLLALLITGAVLTFDVTISYSSPFFFIAFFAFLPLLIVLIHLQVNWTLAPVIVVVESCWGLEPLRRSARLIKGMKRLALSSFLFYGFFSGIVMWNCLLFTTGSNGITDNLALVLCKWLFIVSQSCFLVGFMLSNVAVNTILYIYCKANHGEVVEEFEKDGVTLPLHDEKVYNAV